MYPERFSVTVLVILHSVQALAPNLNDTLSDGNVSPSPSNDSNASGEKSLHFFLENIIFSLLKTYQFYLQ